MQSFLTVSPSPLPIFPQIQLISEASGQNRHKAKA
jgi:hypothetical protein